jgi:hypothetical protein
MNPYQTDPLPRFPGSLEPPSPAATQRFGNHNFAQIFPEKGAI